MTFFHDDRKSHNDELTSAADDWRESAFRSRRLRGAVCWHRFVIQTIEYIAIYIFMVRLAGYVCLGLHKFNF